MNTEKTVQEVFDAWAQGTHALGMEKGHGPVLRQAFEGIATQAGNLLEIGIGNGYGLELATACCRPDRRVMGIDISANMVELARHRWKERNQVQVFHADFATWEPPDGLTFSLIFSMEVFYYFPDMHAAMKKAFRLLEPGGQLWILVDFYRENPQTHDWPRELGVPMQLWSAAEYAEHMWKAGLDAVTQAFFRRPGDGGHGPTLCTRGTRPV